MKQKILYLFTRTPLHVGAGSSVGAIDQPIQRERHTGFPIIPGSSIKGVMRDLFQEDEKTEWLFGPAQDKKEETLGAGALQFTEGRLLAFPVRSARGCFAWLTSPLILNRFARDIGVAGEKFISTAAIEDMQALYGGNMLRIDGDIVLEEYSLKIIKDADFLDSGKKILQSIPPADDPLWNGFLSRLVVVSDGMMSFFASSACEVAQHTRIDDATGTVAASALFNQENVPSEALFYLLATGLNERNKSKPSADLRKDNAAIEELSVKLKSVNNVIQIGGDSSTGLGLCSVELGDCLLSGGPHR